MRRVLRASVCGLLAGAGAAVVTVVAADRLVPIRPSPRNEAGYPIRPDYHGTRPLFASWAWACGAVVGVPATVAGGIWGYTVPNRDQ